MLSTETEETLQHAIQKMMYKPSISSGTSSNIEQYSRKKVKNEMNSAVEAS
jgi:hypothetical protein